MANIGRLIVSIAGYDLTDVECSMLQHPMLAGIILFSYNYKNKDQLSALIAKIQLISNLPIFVDQEGGYRQILVEVLDLYQQQKFLVKYMILMKKLALL